MADYQLTQTGDEVQDILDNSQTGKYFYNQTVATWSSDATYSDYPYKGLITLTGVKGTDGVEVTFSNADATSGNYSPICNTVANGVEIWAKAQDNALVIPTIHITTGADVQLSGDDAYLPISGGNITGSLSVVGLPVVVPYKAGDTVNTSGIIGSGHLTNSQKSVEFFIPLSRPIQATTASINGDAYMRTVGGTYLLNGPISGLGTISTSISAGGVYVRVDSSTALSATNNTPLDIMMKTGSSVTFS